MSFDIKTLVIINLIIQIFLMILISFAAIHAKKKEIRNHCNMIRFAILLQIAATGAVMLPSMLGYLKVPGMQLNQEILFHHALGILLFGLWIYINLVYVKIVRWPGNFISIMRFAYFVWLFVFIIGLHIYSRIYL